MEIREAHFVLDFVTVPRILNIAVGQGRFQSSDSILHSLHLQGIQFGLRSELNILLLGVLPTFLAFLQRNG